MTVLRSALSGPLPASAAGGAVACPELLDYRSQVVELYKKYNPSKLGIVDSLLEKYK